MDIVNINDIHIDNNKNNIVEENSLLFDNGDYSNISCQDGEMLDCNNVKKQIFLILKQHKISVITEHNIWNTYFLINKYIYSNTLLYEYSKKIKKILLESLRDDIIFNNPV